MKTVATILAAAFVLMPWCILPLFSQTQENADKSIVITRRSYDAQGDEITETIVKKGKSAANFDVDAYLRDHSSDDVQVDVQVNCDKPAAKGFLGVSEMISESEQGVAVRITLNSAAGKAGLRTGDILTALDDAPVLDFDDISRFMENSRPGQKVRIAYKRAARNQTTEAVLGECKSWDWTAWSEPNTQAEEPTWNWENYEVEIRDKAACLGVYTGAASIEEKKGAQISSFTTESAAREVNMSPGDLILAVNGQRVFGHEDLWNEIAKYKPSDAVSVEYIRNGEVQRVTANLKACQDASSRVEIVETDEDGDQKSREFTIWNWSPDEQKRLQERRIITIQKGEGDGSEKTSSSPPSLPLTPDRSLKLSTFRAFPNPSNSQLTVNFKAEPVATTVSMFDAAGRQLFYEEMNAFGGAYFQQFDLAAYAKGAVTIQVQQGGKLYSEQVLVN